MYIVRSYNVSFKKLFEFLLQPAYLYVLKTIRFFLPGIILDGWVAKSVARQLAAAALWVRIQTSLKNHK